MLEWNKADNPPDECRVVLCKYDDGEGECFALLTMIGDKWVTDACESELYGCQPHTPIDDAYIPYEWAYID